MGEHRAIYSALPGLNPPGIRETIISTEEKVDANSEKLDKIEEKLYEIIKK